MNRSRRFMAVVALTLHGLALPVAAEVVFYDNTDRIFEWLPQTSSGAPFNYFDPTQPGDQTPFGLTHTYLFPETSTMVAVNSIGADPEPPQRVAIAVDDSFTVHGSEGGEETVTPATTFLPGESVGPAADWASRADHYWITYADGKMPLLGDPPIIGFRTETDGQYQYGWIELGLRTFEAPYFGLQYQPIRWAYETELNTPITVIPEPGSLISLLLCLLVAAWLRSVRPAVVR